MLIVSRRTDGDMSAEFGPNPQGYLAAFCTKRNVDASAIMNATKDLRSEFMPEHRVPTIDLIDQAAPSYGATEAEKQICTETSAAAMLARDHMPVHFVGEKHHLLADVGAFALHFGYLERCVEALEARNETAQTMQVYLGPSRRGQTYSIPRNLARILFVQNKPLWQGAFRPDGQHFMTLDIPKMVELQLSNLHLLKNVALRDSRDTRFDDDLFSQQTGEKRPEKRGANLVLATM